MVMKCEKNVNNWSQTGRLIVGLCQVVAVDVYFVRKVFQYGW
jgi:hypothetical protein